MRILLLAAAIVALAAGGCQKRTFVNAGKDKDGKEYGMLLKSVDRYARKNGISRDEAIRQLRQQTDAATGQGGPAGSIYCDAGARPSGASADPPAPSEPDLADPPHPVQPAAFASQRFPDNPLRR